MDAQKTMTLNNGVVIPTLALGVWRAGEETAQAVAWALQAGYRHIDTAWKYKNEGAVAQGIKAGGVAREEVFITTKLWNDDQRAGTQRKAFEDSLTNLETDYVDLYLLHWPVDGRFTESWAILEDIYASGRARAIGVSNFHERHLDVLLDSAKVVPAINQIECHPHLSQEPLLAACARRGIACSAWSPLGRADPELFNHAGLKEIAAHYGRTVPQIILRWNLQRGVIVLPKSVHRERIAANSRLYDFVLSDSHMEMIGGMNLNRRSGPDPDNFSF